MHARQVQNLIRSRPTLIIKLLNAWSTSQRSTRLTCSSEIVGPSQIGVMPDHSEVMVDLDPSRPSKSCNLQFQVRMDTPTFILIHLNH